MSPARLTTTVLGDGTSPRRMRIVISVLAVAVAALPFTGGPAPALAAASHHTWYVSPHGHDSARGTKHHPFHTVARAVSAAAEGDTIRVRGGIYHQSVTVNKANLTIRGVGSRPAIFDGASRVRGFHRSGSTWVKHGWNVQFDHSPTFVRGQSDGTGTWRFVDPAHPMAAWPDQVWIDGRRLNQVADAAQVGRGDFAVDYGAHQLVVGSNPNGRNVQASRLQQAIEVRAPGVTVDNIDVRRYADSVPDLGVVTAERPHIVLSHMHIVGNATSGVVVTSDHVKIVHSHINRNGLIGIHGSEAYHLRLNHDQVSHNNLERFNMAPVAGGIKMTSSRHIRIANSIFTGNIGTGIWMDSSSYGITVVNNRLRHNAGHGVNLEISDTAIVANNLIVGNARAGIQANDTGNVQIWNNDLVRNGMPLSIVQDTRNPTSSGRDSRRRFPDPTVPWEVRNVRVSNNVISDARPGATCLLCVKDATHRRTGQQLVKADGNAYRRSKPASPTGLVMWPDGSGSRMFPELASFKKETGQEAHGRLTRAKLVTRQGRPAKRYRQIAPHVARPLPAAVAKATGHTPGITHLGLFRVDF
jgi:parallel beta-helix repeat protein